MSKLIPVVLVLVALLGGAGAGHFLKPAPDAEAGGEAVDAAGGPATEGEGPATGGDAGKVAGHETGGAEGHDAVVTFSDGFIVPVLRDGQVWSHVILELGVEAQGSAEETIRLREPVLRDALTEALFLHGSLGGFDGDFTESGAMARLRARLDGVVSGRLGDPTARVLIASLARQST